MLCIEACCSSRVVPVAGTVACFPERIVNKISSQNQCMTSCIGDVGNVCVGIVIFPHESISGHVDRAVKKTEALPGNEFTRRTVILFYFKRTDVAQCQV